jgi:hypothetical protein
MRDTVIVIALLIVLVGWAILRGMWRNYMHRWDEREELHRLASEAAAAAGVKFANEHPRELQAAIYGDGTAEDAAAYRKGQRAVEDAAYNAVLSDPVEARAAARWEESAAKIRQAKALSSDSDSEEHS